MGLLDMILVESRLKWQRVQQCHPLLLVGKRYWEVERLAPALARVADLVADQAYEEFGE